MIMRGSFEWVLFVPFLLFSFFFAWAVFKNILILTRFTKTNGIVGGKTYVASDDRRKEGLYETDVIFVTPDGKEHTVASSVRSNKARHAPGTSVPVYYHPSNPDEARLGTFFDLWLGVLGVGFFWFLLFILWFGTWIGPPPASV